jgi:hypothetical protein
MLAARCFRQLSFILFKNSIEKGKKGGTEFSGRKNGQLGNLESVSLRNC